MISSFLLIYFSYDHPSRKTSGSGFAEMSVDHPRTSSSKGSYESSSIDRKTRYGVKNNDNSYRAANAHTSDISHDEITDIPMRKSPLPHSVSDGYGSMERRSGKSAGNRNFDTDESRHRKISQNSDVFPPAIPPKRPLLPQVS